MSTCDATAATQLTVVAPRPTQVPAFDLGEFARESSSVTVPPASGIRLDESLIPAISVPASVLNDSQMDHLTAFVLLHVDGASSIAELVSMMDLPRLEVIGVLMAALDANHIRMRQGTPENDVCVEEEDAPVPLRPSGVVRNAMRPPSFPDIAETA